MKLSQRVSQVQPSATLSINAKAKALRAQGKKVISFGVGEPDFDTPHHIGQAAIQAVQRGQTRYTAVQGIPELKEAIIDVVRADYGLDYSPEEVLVSCGGKHSLYNLFQAVLDPGDQVIIPAPYWVSYPDMVRLAGAEPVIVDCPMSTSFKLEPQALREAITERTRMLILNSPSNPTGVHYTPEELRGLAQVLLDHEQVVIVSDDIYYRLLYKGAQWANMAMVEPRLKDRTFIVNGVSKTYAMTGWRIGYLLGDADVIKAAGKIQSQSTSNPCSVAQWAAVAALRGSQEDVQTMRQAFARRREYVMERLGRLPGVTCPDPNGAFYVFPNVSAYYGKKAGERSIQGSLDLSDYLMEEAHLAVVPGAAFGEDRCIRLSFALSMEELEEGFDRLEKALGRLS
ncbi:L-aspartate aminotransferase apoenzyme [Desulfacinum hydrothermale DSM 13146]|uniref:Aminotransferase n=1 Tax=Desulfacinum hydrothermale DSM 13146 TaxID=1121390 RepID=A0A1W1X4W6_9BACT|nr:pyridoxal phosphate-dependent aminotransferase [Desulfacinum hydrothermale]SMC18942.1 L-aspartate aminotransferase apoenzyme [Desulfacinum hydrothermale DSM 13146]